MWREAKPHRVRTAKRGTDMSTTYRYRVTGMTCGRCVEHVLEEIREIPGIADATLTVEGDMKIISDSELDFAAVEAAVAEAGDYSVTTAD